MNTQLAEADKAIDRVASPALRLSYKAPFEIILKIQETCNLNCRYCYMYNLGNTLYKQVPPSASVATCKSVAGMICHEFETREPGSARLILHGGEPLLMPIHRFVERMEAIEAVFAARLTPDQREKVLIYLQTNATLVSRAWIDLFQKYGITVSISIDGVAASHDENRVYHDGTGSHNNVLKGLNLLKEAAHEGLIPQPGGLCVINPNASGEETYRFIVETCGLKNIDFLFPFRDWTNYNSAEIARVGGFLTDAFHIWARTRSSDIRVRVFGDAIGALLGKHRQGGDLADEIHGFYVVVESDGSIMPDETLRSSIPTRFCAMNAADVTLSDILAESAFVSMIRQSYSIPQECDGCALKPCCGGGYNLGRYGMRYDGDGYDRKSVFCDAYKDLYAASIGYLHASGVDVSQLALA